MITKLQIEKLFSDFAASHLQIKDYGYGDFSDISMEEGERYPLMWVNPQPCTVEGNEITYSYMIAIADRVYKDLNNDIEVESDTFQICLDILAKIQFEEGDYRLNDSSTITPFKEAWKDEVGGNMMTLNIIITFDYNECAIPN